MKVGLFFGSFNPVHIGHMILANYMLEYTDLEQIWFIVSPQNPFKDKTILLDKNHRYDMVNIAIGDNKKMMTSKIEFDLEQPSYTIDTLNILKKQHPDNEFVIIMGTDNLKGFKKWKSSDFILENYNIYAYSRPDNDAGELKNHKNVKIYNTNMIDLSSTFLRQAIKEKKDIRYMLPFGVLDHINKMNFYQ